MSILFIDTETTGFPNWDIPASDARQCRAVQFAAILADDAGVPKAEISALVSIGPNLEIPEEATKVHGITTDDVRRHGISEVAAVEVLDSLAMGCKIIVAHNVDFDISVIRLMYDRLNRGKLVPFTSDLELMPRRFCTMKSSTNICKLPGKYGYKWPKLIEAYRHFFNEDFEGAHDALADVRACMRLYFKLQELSQKETVQS